ncbi:MAG: beta-ketoacyl-[acyl-carrier-protein] synthase family protein [Nitrospirae bacterium]|nr:beta-ketoacyl-[acyl-carrier-protein] synthase family protein [Nitrospirota bacterium]
MRRVVITGIGAVSPLGNTFKKSWDSLKSGISGIGMHGLNIKGAWRSAGMLKDFHAEEFLSIKEINRLDPFIHYAVSASIMAVNDAGLKGKSLSSSGVLIGSSRGGISHLERALKGTVSAYLMPFTTIGMAGSYVAQRLSIKGSSLGISNSCASGANAIGEAYRAIKHTILDIVLAGASEAPICLLAIEGYGRAGALSRQGKMMPFDRERDGFILSEGSCVLVLEEYESALKRGAKPYAEVIGYACTVDAFHETRPSIAGQADAMKKALLDSGLNPEDIDYINAHATATLIGDKTEAEAICAVFKKTISITANKSMTGHMLGASGALEAGFTAMSLVESIIPPTINLKETEFELDFVTEQRKANIKTAISNSFGFGGVNAVLVLRKL